MSRSKERADKRRFDRSRLSYEWPERRRSAATSRNAIRRIRSLPGATDLAEHDLDGRLLVEQNPAVADHVVQCERPWRFSHGRCLSGAKISVLPGNL
jgi:hypothetical protein